MVVIGQGKATRFLNLTKTSWILFLGFAEPTAYRVRFIVSEPLRRPWPGVTRHHAYRFATRPKLLWGLVMRTHSWQAILRGGLAFGFVAFAVPLLSANPPVAPHPRIAKGTSNPGASATKNAASANKNAVVTVLHQAHALLQSANHDYDGHRAKAAEQVMHAIHALGHHHHHGQHTALQAAQQIAGAFGGGGAIKEPQAQSDAQLKQAGQLLTSLNGSVPNAKAAEHIQAALSELNTALKIR
jgi:hypothetical protein